MCATLAVGETMAKHALDHGILTSGFLLLGAGASRDAGVPTARGFLEFIRRDLEGYPAAEREPLLDAFDAVHAAMSKEHGERSGLEPFYETMDDCMDAHFLGQTCTGELKPSRALERLLYETKRLIQRHCDIRDADRAKYLGNLLRQLNSQRPYPIASFNYDTVVETACKAAGLRFAESVLGEDPSGAAIELVKVHGSISWLPAKGGGLVRNSLYGVSTLNRLGDLRSATLETPLIYPSRRKMPIHDPFMRNALRLQELLADKRRRACIAVGYSFPDQHVRAWLYEAFKARQDLKLYVVDPTPDAALDNLTRNLPTIDWAERLLVVRKGFKDAVEAGFEDQLSKAQPIYEAMSAAPRRLYPLCYEGRVSGLGAAPDGRSLYVADGDREIVVKVDAQTLKRTPFASKLKEPRGVSVTADQRVRVVQNRLLRRRWPGTRGAGSVVEFNRNGDRARQVTRPRLLELLPVVRSLLKGGPTANMWSAVPSVLRWPTDLASADDGSFYVTEARALKRIGESGTHVVAKPELAFNLHGVDLIDERSLVAVELGVGQEFCWGGVLRFDIEGEETQVVRSEAAEGMSRLTAICVVRSRDQVAVTRMLSWPHGALLVLDLPNLDRPRLLEGFDFPEKVAYLPGEDALAVSVRGGVVLVPAADLDEAKPIIPPAP